MSNSLIHRAFGCRRKPTYGGDYPGTLKDFGQAGQFQQTTQCPNPFDPIPTTARPSSSSRVWCVSGIFAAPSVPSCVSIRGGGWDWEKPASASHARYKVAARWLLIFFPFLSGEYPAHGEL